MHCVIITCKLLGFALELIQAKYKTALYYRLWSNINKSEWETGAHHNPYAKSKRSTAKCYFESL